MAKRQARKHSSSPTNSVSPTEGKLEAALRQQQDGLIQVQEELTSDKLPTIIPVPSGAAKGGEEVTAETRLGPIHVQG